MATNPQVPQGTLNRVRCHVVIPSYATLNITSSNMGRNFAKISFEGPFVEQISTGTGIVTSPEPYVMATVNVGVLRTQSLAYSWLTQSQATSYLGNVVIHSDTSAFPAITLADVSIRDIDPGPFDGTDPIVRLDLRGVYYVNNNLWNAL